MLEVAVIRIASWYAIREIEGVGITLTQRVPTAGVTSLEQCERYTRAGSDDSSYLPSARHPIQ